MKNELVKVWFVNELKIVVFRMLVALT